MTEFKVPELGENVESADVARVLVNVGDTIKKEQPVLELETDKATIEVPSSVAGVIKEVKVKKGEKVQVGAVILTVDDSASGNGAGASAAAAKSAESQDTKGGEAAQQPKEAPSKEAPPKEAAPKEAAPKEAAPPPAAAERPPDHKVLSMPQRPTGARGEAVEGRQTPPPEVAPPPRPDRGPAAPASPSVRRLAREIGVDINQVQGSGPAGRISLDDVKDNARRVLTSVGSAAPSAGGAARVRPLPDLQKWGEVDRQPWSNIRRSTAEHLSYAWNAIPHVTQFDKADVTALEALRKAHKDRVEKAGGNLTVTAILVKVLATAVRQFPQFNASLDTERGEIVYRKYVNIGVAVDTDRGLLVPVVRNADRKNITEIAVEVSQLAAKARDRKLTLDEMSGGGMSISNLGGIGGTYFTPIVNWPEVAILGVSRGAMEPVWVPSGTGAQSSGAAGQFEPRLMLPLSLSYDHRVIDGADAIRFLRWVAEAIEQPFLLSLIG
ncbi:MAG TPA: 2-oxo acid dehydrogenase subunit E2 [Vicinamibacterales bacterium]|nr:2-oxo acid dehydrogenase subunit E2 [Vicinamibacterales bacterium]